MAKNILITGGAGFIGSELSRLHIEKGDSVWVIDNLSAGKRENIAPYLDIETFHFSEKDLRNCSYLLQEAIRWADRIYHMAAVVGQRQVLSNPIETLTNHINCCQILLEEVDKVGKKVPILIASSSSVYYHTAPEEDGTLHEDTVLNYISGELLQQTYPISKLFTEYLSLAYVMEKEFFCTIVRPFNTIGINQRSRYGMVLPNFVRQAINEEPITVFGTGRQYRAFTNVHDTCRALDLLMENPMSSGMIVNVGSQQKSTILDLAHLVKKCAKSSSKIIFIPYKKAYGVDFKDVDQRCPNTDLLYSLTRFQPEWSLEETVEEVIEFEREKLYKRTA